MQTQRIDDTGTFVDAKLVLHDAPFNVPVKTATVGSTTLVVHADQRGGDTNLYGRRLSGASVLDEQWFLLPTGATAEANPSIAWDGDQYFSVWEHCCGGTTGNDIHGRFFDADGAPIGPEVAISSAITHESEPRIVFDGTRFLVVWREISGGARSLRAARVATDGTVLDATPVTVASGLNPQDHEVVWDGTTFVVVWDGQSTPGVRAARVGSDGSVLDPTPILIAGGFSFLGGIASDGSGSMIVYQDPSGWRRLAPLDIGVVGTPIDVAFWQFSSPGTLSWSGSEYLVTASRFGRRVSGAGAVVGGQIDFGPGADVADAAWHGTHWVTLVRAGAGASVFGVSARIVTASGAVLAPVSIGSVPNGSVAVPYSSHPGIGMDIAAGPDNQLAIVTHRRDATVGEGTYQSHLRFFDSLPTVSVSPSNVNEGSSGTTNLTFTVRLTPPSNEVVTLSYTTIGGDRERRRRLPDDEWELDVPGRRVDEDGGRPDRR